MIRKEKKGAQKAVNLALPVADQNLLLNLQASLVEQTKSLLRQVAQGVANHYALPSPYVLFIFSSQAILLDFYFPELLKTFFKRSVVLAAGFFLISFSSTAICTNTPFNAFSVT